MKMITTIIESRVESVLVLNDFQKKILKIGITESINFSCNFKPHNPN